MAYTDTSESDLNIQPQIANTKKEAKTNKKPKKAKEKEAEETLDTSALLKKKQDRNG